MADIPDVDIEVNNRDRTAGLFQEAITASQIAHSRLIRHNSGLYFQAIPTLPDGSLAAFPYEEAEALGYYKIDLLSLPNPYDRIETQEDLRELLDLPIDWDWFKNADFVSSLFHLNGIVGPDMRMADVVAYYEPQSIDDLAVMVALKLPAKKHLIGESWETLRAQIWVKETSGKPQFKKSHSVAYALAVGIDARIKASEYFDNA